MDANGSCGCDAGTGFVAMQNLPESEDDDEEEGDEEIQVQTRRELRCMQLFYVVLHELAGCMLTFVLCLIMHDMHVHFQRVSIATCCHHVGFCGTTGHAGLGFCPVEAPSRATERKVSFSQDTSFVHHMCSQSHNLLIFSRAKLIISHVFISFCGMEEGGQDSERTRAMRQGEAKHMLK